MPAAAPARSAVSVFTALSFRLRTRCGKRSGSADPRASTASIFAGRLPTLPPRDPGVSLTNPKSRKPGHMACSGAQKTRGGTPIRESKYRLEQDAAASASWPAHTCAVLEVVATTAPEQLPWLCQVLPGTLQLAAYCGVEPHHLAGTLAKAITDLDRLQTTRQAWEHPGDVRMVEQPNAPALFLLAIHRYQRPGSVRPLRLARVLKRLQAAHDNTRRRQRIADFVYGDRPGVSGRHLSEISGRVRGSRPRAASGVRPGRRES